MIRVLTIFLMCYTIGAFGMAAHDIVVDGGGTKNSETISQDVLERAVLWPIKIFQ